MTANVGLSGGQSPIDIDNWVASEAPPPSFAYGSGVHRIEPTQGLVMIHFQRGSELLVGNESYRLLQLHWHTPAEHTIDGQEFDAELHFVHINESEELLVVGAVYQIGEADGAAQQIIEAASHADREAHTMTALSAADLAPASDGFYCYTGSLTAAPFSEPVQWYVGQTIRQLSQRQVDQLQQLTGGPNARPLQARHDRTILCLGCSRN